MLKSWLMLEWKSEHSTLAQPVIEWFDDGQSSYISNQIAFHCRLFFCHLIRFNFTCQNLAHSFVLNVAFFLSKKKTNGHLWQQLNTSRRKKEKKSIRTSHKHVTIFISLVDVFSSQHHHVHSLKFTFRSTIAFVFVYIDFFFGGTIFIRKCSISMWNFSFVKLK